MEFEIYQDRFYTYRHIGLCAYCFAAGKGSVPTVEGRPEAKGLV